MRYAIIDVPYSYGELSILLKDSCLTMPSWVYNTYALLVVDESGTYSKWSSTPLCKLDQMLNYESHKSFLV